MELCPGCGVPVRADVFNAFLRRDDLAPNAESILEQGQAECFYHPGKQAEVPCSACGRLLCAVCRVDMEGAPLCMRCLQSGRDKQKIPTLQNQRVLYDEIAFVLSFWPMFFIFPTLLTAPAAIYFAIRHWRMPAGVLPRKWVKNGIALLLAALQCVGWITFIAYRLYQIG
jgi:hypothetical protein